MTSKEIREMEIGEERHFEREQLKKIRSYIQGKRSYIIVSTANGGYKLVRLR